MTQAICDITTDEVNVDVVVEPQADTMVEVANRAGGMEQVFHDNTLIGNGNSIDLGVNTDLIATKEYVDEKVESIDTYTKDQIDGKLTAVDAQIDANADAIQKTREDYIQADSEIHQILNNHAENLTTLHNDVDDLGDQVAEIESKIPESASSTNQLATKADLANVDLDGYVKKSGDTMTGDLVFDVAARGYNIVFQDSYSTGSVIKRITSPHQTQGLIFSEHKNGTVNMQFSMIADGFFMPHGNRLLGSTDYPWNNIYAKKLNNGADVAIPTEGGTLARVEDLIDLRADINETDSELQTQITAQAAEIATKQDQLTAGDNIIISNNVISATGAGGGTGFDVQVVQELPATGQKGIIYLLAKDGTAPDVYDEYVWITATQTFELIGTTQVDLTDYAKVSYVNSADQQLRANQTSLYNNQIELRDMLNAKDAGGNWTTLTTTAQAAIPAINELNEKIESAGGGASLPDMTDNAGKFLTNDGETASWGASYAKSDYVDWADATYHKINIGTADAYTGGVSATAAYVAIGAKNCGAGCVAILGSAQYSSSVAIGNNSIAEYNSTAIGNNAQAKGGSTTQGTIAIGYGAKTGSVKCAIQLGGNGAFDGYTNSDANTFKVGNANGNFEMMSADGTIPAERMSATAGTTGQVLTKTDTGMAWADASGGDGDIDCGVMS